MSDRAELKKKVESVLFSAGNYLSIEDIGKHCEEANPETIKEVLLELRQELDTKDGSIMLVNEGNYWKLTVRERYASIVRKIVKQTELPRSILETLAIVAYKAPVLQSQVIKIRTNKAYKHLDDLEQKEYITREKKGRTKLIKLTTKFFEYFDVPPEKLKEKFAKFQKTEQEIREKEGPAPEVDLIDDKGRPHELKTFDAIEPLKDESKEELLLPLELEKAGGLEVYGTAQEEPEAPVEKPKHERKKKAKKPAEEAVETTEEVTEPAEEKEEQEETEAAEETKEEETQEAPAEEPEETAEEEKEEKEETAEEKEETKEEPEEVEEKTEEEKPKKMEELVMEEAKKAMPKGPALKGKGLFSKGIPKDVEEKINKRVEEIIHPPKEEDLEETEEHA